MPPPRKSLDVDALATMYLEGATLQQLATRFGVTAITARKRLNEAGVPIRPPGARNPSAAQAHTRRLTDEQEREAAERYAAGELVNELAVRFGVGRKTITNTLRRQGRPARNKQEAQAHLNERRRARGQRHPNFKGGRSVTKDGYTLIGIDETDPMWAMAKERRRKDYAGYLGTGYVLEHRLVMARHLGRALTSCETVHHLNGKRDDNRIENLELWTGKHGKGVRHDESPAHCPTCTCFAHD